ncbi:MAG: GNAT family N-acetyltransferase [Pseudomonadota bacterium]
MPHATHLFFESDRLIYRPLELDDLDLAIEQWTDPEVVKYVDWDVSTVDEIKEEMPMVIRRAGPGGCIGIWVLTCKETQEKLGTAILLPMPVEADDTEWDLMGTEAIPDREIEVGYILKRSAWGKGYATEACRRMLKFGFEHTPLNEIVACIDPENDVSRKVLLKSGLREEGLIKAYTLEVPGFRITRTHWCGQT